MKSKSLSPEYDALGRRTAKIANFKITRYLWDGNVLLHEWTYGIERRPLLQMVGELGELFYEKEPVDDVITWVYDEGCYTPIAKLINGERYSIVSDYIGRPVQCFDDNGEMVWETDYDVYGRLKKLNGEKHFIPFRQMGQYEDAELGGVYYNRFRYYDSGSGVYISQDPIGLEGGLALYGYVKDSNSWVDVFGLRGDCCKKNLGPKLPLDIADTFVNSAYSNRKLTSNERFFKYHGVDNRTNRKYTWLTKSKYPTEDLLREKLAIRREWGVKIEYVSEFDAPAGTWVSEGKSASQGINYGGGDYQAVISNTPKSWIIKTTQAFK